MKFEYVERAKWFMKDFLHYINNDTFILNDAVMLSEAIEKYNKTFDCNLCYDSGQTRHVLIYSDFVIKWDKGEERIKRFGGCENEVKMYDKAEDMGMAYLLARITPIEINGLNFYVMPKVDYVAEADIYEYLTEQEIFWMDDNLGDIHSENWGWIDDNVVIFDYACGVVWP